jgi:cystathionine beta-lyase
MSIQALDQTAGVFPFDVPIADLRRRSSAKWTTFAADVLPLPVAEMDVRLAPPIRAALQTAIDASDTGYAGDPGALIEAFCGFAGRRWNWRIGTDEVRVCADVAVGVVEVLRKLAAPGDAVIITPPVYPRFYAWLRETSLRPIEIPLQNRDHGGRLDLDGIAAAFSAGARIILICHPHNPTGSVHTASELRSLAELAAHHGAIVLADEIHAPLAYRTAEFHPYLTLSEEARATGITFASASKAWNIPGLKCALIVATGPPYERVLKQIPPGLASGVGHFGMLASTAAFAQGETWLDTLIAALEANVAVLRAELSSNIPQIAMANPRAGYLAWLNCSALGLAADPAALFLEHGRVALFPGRSFGFPGADHARLNFACSSEILREAVSRMARAIHAVGGRHA